MIDLIDLASWIFDFVIIVIVAFAYRNIGYYDGYKDAKKKYYKKMIKSLRE